MVVYSNEIKMLIESLYFFFLESYLSIILIKDFHSTGFAVLTNLLIIDRSSPDVQYDVKDVYKSYTANQLKAELRRKGLRTSGRKSTLVRIK